MKIYHQVIIKALSSKKYRVNCKTGEIFGPKGKLKIAIHGKQRYPTVSLAVRGSWGTFMAVPAHKVIGFARWGLKSFDKDLCVRHLGKSVIDCSWSSLALGTHSQNNMDKDPKIRSRAASIARKSQGYNGSNRRFNREQVLDIRRTAAKSKIRGTKAALARKYNVSKTVISDTCLGRDNIYAECY